MITAKTPEELADQIERVVHAYVQSVRAAAEAAVARSFGAPAQARRPTPRAPTPKADGSNTPRRTAKELAELQTKLEQLVGSHPGVSMARLAAELGSTARLLHRPMSQLRSAGRVRSVGDKSLTRYFPCVGATG